MLNNFLVKTILENVGGHFNLQYLYRSISHQLEFTAVYGRNPIVLSNYIDSSSANKEYRTLVVSKILNKYKNIDKVVTTLFDQTRKSEISGVFEVSRKDFDRCKTLEQKSKLFDLRNSTNKKQGDVIFRSAKLEDNDEAGLRAELDKIKIELEYRKEFYKLRGAKKDRSFWSWEGIKSALNPWHIDKKLLATEHMLMHIDGHLLQKTQTDEQSDLSFLECLRDNPASQQGELKKLYDELHGYTTLSDEIKNNERKNFMTKNVEDSMMSDWLNESKKSLISKENEPYFDLQKAVISILDVDDRNSTPFNTQSDRSNEVRRGVIVCSCPKELSNYLKQLTDEHSLDKVFSEKLNLAQSAVDEFVKKQQEESETAHHASALTPS